MSNICKALEADFERYLYGGTAGTATPPTHATHHQWRNGTNSTDSIYVHVADDTKVCSWCHGKTKTDMRGHCLACGGPR